MSDLILKNAYVVDGTGTAGYRGHIVIRNGLIQELLRAEDSVPGGYEVLDVEGLAVAPGFIDMHSHSDGAVVQGGDHEAKLLQGVTLEVCGQDGMGLAPVGGEKKDDLLALVEAWYGPMSGETTPWESVGDYLNLIDEGSPTNIAYLVPLGTVRAKAMGFENRLPTSDEMDLMKQEIIRGMNEGALGVSSGLSYTPGSYAGTDELVSLCTVAGEMGGFHATHQRSYGEGCYEGYQEAMEISRQSGCPVHLAHAVIDFPQNYGRDRDLFVLLDSEQLRGGDVSFDAYPYELANTKLSAMLPGWVQESGLEGMRLALSDPESREKIRVEMEEIGSDGAFGIPMGWELYEIGSRPASNQWVGKTIHAAATEANKGEADFFFDILLEDDFGTLTLIHMGHEEHIQRTMQHAAFTVGSDGILLGDRPHPRGWGSFPRYLGHYARDLELLRLEECVAHMTSLPAQRLKLKDRGLIARGFKADLVVFDPATIGDRATYDSPKEQPVGIPHVLIDGRFAVRDSKTTGIRAGRGIRRGRDTNV